MRPRPKQLFFMPVTPEPICNYDSRRVWVSFFWTAEWTCRCKLRVHIRLPTSNCTTSPRYTTACKTIVHGLVTSKLDFGNAVFCGINGQLLQKLQRVQSWVARVNYAAAAPRPPSHHASADSATLAADSMAHNIQDTGFDLPPEYIADTITEYTSRRQLRSAESPESTTPLFRTLWSAWLHA